MTGCTQAEGLKEVEASIDRLFTYAAWADKYGGSVQETPLYGVTMAIHEPVGVIGMVCPKENPLLGFVSMVAPAVVRGNTVVVVPSEDHPLAATDLYQVLDTSDLPGGVINILTGEGDVLAKTLSEHQDVDSVWCVLVVVVVLRSWVCGAVSNVCACWPARCFCVQVLWRCRGQLPCRACLRRQRETHLRVLRPQARLVQQAAGRGRGVPARVGGGEKHLGAHGLVG